MTDREWARIVALITMNWPHSLPPEGALLKWRSDLADLAPAHAEAAVEAFAADGERFPPNGYMIRRKVTELALDAPEWVEASAILGSIFDEPVSCMVDGESVPLRLRKIQGLSPLLQAFVGMVGLEALDRGLAGGSEEARLRDKWRAFVARAQRDRNYAAIPPAGLAGLERGSERPRLIADVVKQIEARR